MAGCQTLVNAPIVMTYALRKLKRQVGEEGVLSATTAIINHGGKTVDRLLRGTPGYYRLHRAMLDRRYDAGQLDVRWVDPADIEYLTGTYERRETGHLDYVPYFKPREANWDHLPYEAEVPYGAVRGGDWDRSREPFASLLMFQGVEQRINDGMDWESTVYFEELYERFIGQAWETTAARRLALERCERLDSLYRRIDSNGYQSQAELNGHPLHEVTVTVGRDGTLLYNCEGRNRLCLVKILGIDEIPVLVLVRHSEFVEPMRGEA